MPSASQVRQFDPLSASEWDALTASHVRASFFYSSGWLRVLREMYGHTPYYLGLMNGTKSAMFLPILEVSSPWTGRRGVSLPFSDECGVLSFDDAEGEELFRHALELGRQRHWKHLELRGRTPAGWKALPWVSYFGHEVDISDGDQAVFERFDSSVRRAIRKAEKCGVKTEISTTLAAVRDFYELHCQTRRKHGVPPQPFLFFEKLHQHALETGGGFILTARYEGKPVAAGVFLHHGRSGMYKFGASDENWLHLRANDLVMFEAMKWYARRGYVSFSMGRTSPTNDGLRRFKRGFGAREYAVDYFRYDLRGERFVTGTDEKSGWINRMFRLMPVGASRMIGELLYRHMD